MTDQRSTDLRVDDLQSLAQICAATEETLDMQQAICKITETLLEIFKCDRAWMLFPGNPDSPTWRIPVISCSPSWPSGLPENEDLPMLEGHRKIIASVLAAKAPVCFDRAKLYKLDSDLVEQFSVQSQMLVALNPKNSAPWILGLHQCSGDRSWTDEDQALFAKAGQRISSVITNLLLHKNLQEREERLQLAIEAAGDGVWDWNVETGEVIFSEGWARILGYKLGEIKPNVRTLEGLVHPDDIPRVRGILQSHIDGEADHYRCEHRIRTKSGIWKWVLDRGKVVGRNESGKPLRVHGTRRDISAKKQSEELLMRERRLFTGGPCVVFRWVASEGWPVEYVSPNVLGFFGYSDHDFMTGVVLYSDVIYPEDLERVAAEVQAHSDSGVTQFEQEYRIVRPSGEVRWLYDFTVINRDEEGSITHFEGYVLDATERKLAEGERLKLEAKVQHAQKLESLGVLAGGIAHDFNNLLMGVMGHADLALDVLPEYSPAARSLNGILSAAKQAADLTQQMLAYSGKGKYFVEAMDLNISVREMGRLLEVTVSKMATLEYYLADNLPSVEADSSQLGQVIMNLITNAAEAIGDQQGVISITTGVVQCDREYLSMAQPTHDLEEGLYVFVDVSDTGVGMDLATLDKIFDPFFTTKFTGRGLGLAAVQGIVQGHGGALCVSSEVDSGTTFKVLVPASTQPAQERAPELELEEWMGSGTILLVDDEETVRMVGSLMLETLGFHVIMAEDGPAALDLFREHQDEISCVLLDLTMPTMNGDEVFSKLRKIDKDVIVILSSGYNQTDVVQKFTGTGLAGFIQKPYGRKNLAKVLRKGLS